MFITAKKVLDDFMANNPKYAGLDTSAILIKKDDDTVWAVTENTENIKKKPLTSEIAFVEFTNMRTPE